MRRALGRAPGGVRVVGRFDRETIECRHTMEEHSLARLWPIVVSRLEKAGLAVVARPGQTPADGGSRGRVSPRSAQEKILVIGLPEAMGSGRFRVSVNSVSGSMPRAQKRVAATSSGVTGSIAG